MTTRHFYNLQLFLTILFWAFLYKRKKYIIGNVASMSMHNRIV